MKTPCVDCQTIELCAAEGFECGHDDVERAPMIDMRRIIELQVKVHILESRLEALERHRHTVTFDLHEYTQQVTTSEICYATK